MRICASLMCETNGIVTSANAATVARRARSVINPTSDDWYRSFQDSIADLTAAETSSRGGRLLDRVRGETLGILFSAKAKYAGVDLELHEEDAVEIRVSGPGSCETLSELTR